ncbi:MAG TPA: hypothetical protein VFR24_04540 [Candidatus Angelobacter sp.]|nr:hypothetical protein [Candidatus Angelobacter sp.]
MLVMVIGFGSNWWARFGRDPNDRYRFTRHAAYFNSTGVSCGSKVQRYWLVPGLVRFNGVGDFTPGHPNRCLGKTFECADLKFALGGNRLLFIRKAVDSSAPDYYLVAISSNQHGYFEPRSPAWKSEMSIPLAVSLFRNRCEGLLLMKSGDWVQTVLGIWQLNTVDVGKPPVLALRAG